jgi:hypothetical protein
LAFGFWLLPFGRFKARLGWKPCWILRYLRRGFKPHPFKVKQKIEVAAC